MKIVFVFFFLFISKLHSQDFLKAIEDNSFFIEEAYNQESGVIQHIANLNYFFLTKNYLSTFTQEWPIVNQKNQFSFSIPFNAIDNKGDFGNIMFNYRYQLTNKNGFAISPRISFSKNVVNDFTTQLNLPISMRISNYFVSHFNLGKSFSNNNYSDFFIGTSGIYLLDKNFNLVLEILYTQTKTNLIASQSLIFNPAIRFAINFENLQIVPGVGFPFTIKKDKTEKGIFLYLSFEHPI